jgi:hypothetical protein
MTLFSEATRQPPDGAVLPSQGGHRPLRENVLQSADEAVAAEPTQDGQAGETIQMGWAGIDPVASPFGPGADTKETKEGWMKSMQDEVAQYAAVEPIKATLMAVGAGALLAMVANRLTSRGKRRTQSKPRR